MTRDTPNISLGADDAMTSDERNIKLLREVYRSRLGAEKRAGFENSMAGFEYRSGHKAAHYRYVVVEHEGAFRVARQHRD